MLEILLTLFVYNYTTRREALIEDYLQQEALDEAQWLDDERRGHPSAPLPEHPPTIRWTLERDGAELVASYEVFNPGEDPIWVFDELEGGDEAVRVRRGETDSQAVLFKGVFAHQSCFNSWSFPVYARRVEPGEVVAGQGRTTLPVRADVVSGSRQVLTSAIEEIVLEIAWAGQNDELEALYPIDEWGPRVPLVLAHARQRWLVSEALPLPD